MRFFWCWLKNISPFIFPGHYFSLLTLFLFATFVLFFNRWYVQRKHARTFKYRFVFLALPKGRQKQQPNFGVAYGYSNTLLIVKIRNDCALLCELRRGHPNSGLHRAVKFFTKHFRFFRINLIVKSNFEGSRISMLC